MIETDREHLVDNIVDHASDEVTPATQLRVVAYCRRSTPTSVRAWRRGSGIDAGTANGDLVTAREAVFAHANHA